MIKIRLEGLPEEIAKAEEKLKSEFEIACKSTAYPNRDSRYVRVYLECRLSNKKDYAVRT